MKKVRVKVINGVYAAELPQYETNGSAGLDVRANIDKREMIMPGYRTVIPTGIRAAIPDGYELQIRPRSGLAVNHGITLLNSPGTIDSDYRGEICIIMINHGINSFTVERGMRIAQLVLAPVVQLEWVEVSCLPLSDRGKGGFGSTGNE